MSAHDKTEKVLRDLHVLLSKSEPYPKEPTKVIVDKQKMLDLLSDLNKSMYDIMEEYEMTQRSRDKAQREFQKKGDEIVWDASRKAEDIYAASVMYTDEALNRIQDIMRDSNEKVQQIYKKVEEELKEQESAVKKNQLELKSSLQDLLDTEKYLKLIEERNREIEKEKHEKDPTLVQEANRYANRQSQVRVNKAVLSQLGIETEEEPQETEQAAGAEKGSAQKEAQLREDLDADYFKWKEENAQEKESKTEKGGGFLSALKNLGSTKR